MVTDFFFKTWPEFFFFVLMVVGVIIALAAPSAVISYTIIFISGMMAGRILYWKKKYMKVGYYIAIFGFLIGFVIGSYYGNRKLIIILFILGSILSYHLYDKKILKDTFF